MLGKLMTCAAVVLMLASAARAETIEEKAQVCAGCHGADGKPIDKTIPVLWGQTAGYIYMQLRDFKSAARKSEIMEPLVSEFQRDDMLALAEYFSQKPWPDLGQPRAPKDVAAKALAASASIGCPACHLDRFQGDGTVPRLAGQGRDYLAKTIDDFRTRARANNPGMSDLMQAASPEDLTALADYLAGL